MKKFPLWAIGLLLLVSVSWIPASLKQENLVKTHAIPTITASTEGNSEESVFEKYVNAVYTTAGLEKTSLDLNVFRKAVIGYYNFKNSQLLSSAKSLITIVDFNKSSKQKRLWIVDLVNQKLLYNTLVAHGQGTGDDMAQNFSNNNNSHQSSLGFYITSEVYNGKHGLSLKLDGMDAGFNTNARDRAIVVHGADYVSQSFIDQHGRLGRSHGCPALPVELTASIIDIIKGKTCLYINGASKNYTSSHLDQNIALENFSRETNSLHASL